MGNPTEVSYIRFPRSFHEMVTYRMSVLGWMAFMAVLCADVFPSLFAISIGWTEANPIGFPSIIAGRLILMPLTMHVFERWYHGPKSGWSLIWMATFLANMYPPVANLVKVIGTGA